jgi:DNA-binding NarL/FixJ family response regulator
MSAAVEVWLLLDRDDPLVTSVSGAFEGAPDFSASRRAWPSRRESRKPGVIVCRTPAREPLTALKRRLLGPVVLAVFTPEQSLSEVRGTFVQGADAVLLEEDVPEKLLLAVRAVLGGLVVLSPPFAPAIERPPLTPREKQVLALVVMNFSNREIADQLVVSESTVKSHLFSAFRRLGVRTRSEAVAVITDPSRGFGSGILSIPQE